MGSDEDVNHSAWRNAEDRVREIVRNECGEDTHVTGLRARMNGKALKRGLFQRFKEGITAEEVIGKISSARAYVGGIPELGEVVIQLRDSEEQEYLRSQDGSSGGGGFTVVLKEEDCNNIYIVADVKHFLNKIYRLDLRLVELIDVTV